MLPGSLRLGPPALGHRRGLGRLPEPLVELGLILLGRLELLLELAERELERHPIGPVPGLEGLALDGEPGLGLGLGRFVAALVVGAEPGLDLDELLVRDSLPAPRTCVLLLHRLLHRHERHLFLSRIKKDLVGLYKFLAADQPLL